MLLQAISLLVLNVVFGLSVGYLVNKYTDIKVLPFPFFLGMAIGSILIIVVVVLGWNIAKADKLSFNEYWNGWEEQAIWDKIPCGKDGPCAHEYACDPYQEAHYSTDEKGNLSVTYTTEYHACPYVTEEWRFVVQTSLGDYVIASNNFPDNPVEWRIGGGIPDVSRGIPEFWAAAERRISSGKPGPVTKRMQYDNFILASDKTILNQYSDKIQQYEEVGLLPKVINSIHDFYYADKVYFVGFSPPDTVAWQTSLMYLNAALGTDLQGDLHLVIVQNELVNNEPDTYLTALKAYWSDPTVFNDNTISKNTIIIVLGTTDGKTIAWGRAITGMPLGNEYMINVLQNKAMGVELSPDKSVDLIKNVLWGVDDPKSKFARISMSGGNENDNGSGFKYLSDEIEPSDGQKTIFMIISLVLSLTVWGIATFLAIEPDDRIYRSSEWR